MPKMKVKKRNGKLEEVQFDKITKRIQRLLDKELSKTIDPVEISQKICNRVYDGIPTYELDNLAAELCINMAEKHIAYSKLAAKIAIDNHHKNTSNNFFNVVEKLYNNKDVLNNHAPLVNKKLFDFVESNKENLEKMIHYDRDFKLDYFGFKTLMKAYLKRIDNEVIERPQHMWLRVAIGIHDDDLDAIKMTYNLMSNLYFTHATPTLFHAGTPRPQLSSCFLLDGSQDSVDGIYDTIKKCAVISKWAGGIGVHISGIRATGSYIRKTGGYSDGILPMMKVYNDSARYINQSGRRPGSFAMYIEPWHADIFQFLDAKKNHGNEEERARDLFYALWIPDLFMKHVKDNKKWYLMCPDESPGLHDVYGSEFETLYLEYVDKGKYRKEIDARELWIEICKAQIETGTPYMLYKDACNNKSNQKNLGTIKCSNLCTEIVEYTSPEETAVCNLASIAVSKCLKLPKVYLKNVIVYTKQNCKWCVLVKGLLKRIGIEYKEIEVSDSDFESFKQKFNVKTLPQVTSNSQLIGGYTKLWEIFSPQVDYDLLKNISKIITFNLNKIIDINFYPIESAKRSNMKHRPIGIGIQGLADVFQIMKIPFDSDRARQINKNIFETIYYGALEASMELSRIQGPYETFKGSPFSKGELQFDLWEKFDNIKVKHSGLWNWEKLKKDIIEHGVRNSLLLAPMPTASTSQILGNNECIEPYTSNMYTRRTIAGEFTVINKWLIQDLIDIDLWNEEMKTKIMYYRGSIQKISEIPQFLKNVYKTVWEIKQKVLIDMAADRGVYVDQSQSLNIFMESPDVNTLNKCHFYSWKKGLKTGSYYIRSKPAANSQSFTLDPDKVKQIKSQERNTYEPCLTCSS